MPERPVIVIGGGIAGLTAAALLAHEGVSVIIIEAQSQIGGCAGTYKRGPYTFDVGATQVAGLEFGGIHERLFRHLKMSPLDAEILDPACVVDLADGSQPVNLWHDTKKWKNERESQFPGSKPFWDLCNLFHQSNWSFAARDPILPARNLWDVVELLKAIRPSNLFSGLFSVLSIADLLLITGCNRDQRLKNFLDLQLKLYSQYPSDRTSALYGSTVLHIAQSPLGLWHLNGSMQDLSNHLRSSLLRDSAKILLGHRVISLSPVNKSKLWKVLVKTSKGKILDFQSEDVVFTLPPQCLPELILDNSTSAIKYLKSLRNLPKPSGAIVFYGAVNRNLLPTPSITHLQIASKIYGSLFLSISKEGDGRAPIGQATVIASVFEETEFWSSLTRENYLLEKKLALNKMLKELQKHLGIDSEQWLHKELATPKSFERWTGRPKGIVGGLGQNPFRSGLFGLRSRTPLLGLWLCGDSIHPGEGTAGVSQSALMVCKQLMTERGYRFEIES